MIIGRMEIPSWAFVYLAFVMCDDGVVGKNNLSDNEVLMENWTVPLSGI